MSVDRIIYCANTCTRDDAPVTTTAPSQLCDHCEENLHRWLNNITNTWAMLPMFVSHGTIERNPDSKATKSAVAQAPMRLEIIDLLDTRLGRKWNGTAAAKDRRGVAGNIQAHVERLMEERPLTTLKHDHRDVEAACQLLDRHRLWLAEQDWISYLYEDIRVINLQLSNAIGDYKRPAVGTCHVVPENANKACGGPLYANKAGGVRCARCQATWDASHLRQLGLAQAAAQQESA